MSDVVGRLRGIAGQATPGPWEPKDNLGDIYSESGRYICDTLIEMAQDFGLGEAAKADAEHIATFDPQLVGAMLEVIDAVLELAPGYAGHEGPYLEGVSAAEMQAVNDALARFREVAS